MSRQSTVCLNIGVAQEREPVWLGFPMECRNHHPWGPRTVTVSWEPCDCPAARRARGGHIKVVCNAPGCPEIWLRPKHEPVQHAKDPRPSPAHSLAAAVNPKITTGLKSLSQAQDELFSLPRILGHPPRARLLSQHQSARTDLRPARGEPPDRLLLDPGDHPSVGHGPVGPRKPEPAGQPGPALTRPASTRRPSPRTGRASRSPATGHAQRTDARPGPRRR